MSLTRRIKRHTYIPLPQPSEEIRFRFNGRSLQAMEGETITTALLASGIEIFSRSFKYHRPRGVYDNHGQGAETLVTVDHAPNLLADRTLVKEGMDVKTQNAWPSVHFDFMSINNFLVPLLPNGFYYKMFHKPKWAWPIFEKFIRKAAGIGSIDTEGHSVETRYEKRYRFPDVCVVGSGPAGLAAAEAAAEVGKQVLFIEEQSRLGGHSLHTLLKIEGCIREELNGLAEYEAIPWLTDRLKNFPNLEILTETNIFGVYEDNLVAAQKGTDLFKIRAESVVLATGATDRHLVFENNDKPGIMTARGVESLIGLHSIKPGQKAVVVTCHDGGYHTAKMLYGAGTEVVGIADARPNPERSELYNKIRDIGIPVFPGETIHSAHGFRSVKSITLGDPSGKIPVRRISCDLVVIAVGLKPQLQLLSMGRSRPMWDSVRGILRMQDLPKGIYSAGEVNGFAPFARIYKEGWEVGKAAAKGEDAPKSSREARDNLMVLPPDIESKGKNHFICKCMDVTRKEAVSSIDEGFDQVETLKRYTSMGMGPCQGKSCHEAVSRLAALDTGLDEMDAVPTTVRPPICPVPFGTLAGRSHHLVPIRRTALHDCHVQAGSSFLNVGQWKRPFAYTDPHQEAEWVRKGLAIIDVSTLGKLKVRGVDAVEFLQFLLPGKFQSLTVGKTRYSPMIGEDGIVFEDMTVSQIEEGIYYLTTSTGNQEAVLSLIRWWLTTSNFNVHLTNLGSSYSAVNLSGVKSREFLKELVDIDLTNESFPPMGCRKGFLANVPVMLFRLGFTGELSYEIHFPSEYGESMWNYLMKEGEPYGLQPFGVEAQRILRLEKGHLLPGVDTDALSNPYEAGLGFAIKGEKSDFVGKAFLTNFMERGLENQLVPYKLKTGEPIPDEGVAVFNGNRLIGRVTSSKYSPVLGYGIGLAWVTQEFSNSGSRIRIRLSNGSDVEGEVLGHAAFDPEGTRLKA